MYNNSFKKNLQQFLSSDESPQSSTPSQILEKPKHRPVIVQRNVSVKQSICLIISCQGCGAWHFQDILGLILLLIQEAVLLKIWGNTIISFGNLGHHCHSFVDLGTDN